jgi:hypothetical protein
MLEKVESSENRLSLVEEGTDSLPVLGAVGIGIGVIHY